MEKFVNSAGPSEVGETDLKSSLEQENVERWNNKSNLTLGIFSICRGGNNLCYYILYSKHINLAIV